MLKLDYNIISRDWKEKMKSLSEEQRKLIDAPIGKENLLLLKKSKDSIKTGDVFVLSFKEGLYFYGKVLEANVKHEKNSWINGCHVVFIFRNKSHEKNLNEFNPDYNNLLCGPAILTSGYWENGWFETIGNISLTTEEKKLDYGFFDMDSLKGYGTFQKANGDLLKHIPKIYGSSGIKTYVGIYMAVKDETIIDPTLLEENEME